MFGSLGASTPYLGGILGVIILVWINVSLTQRSHLNEGTDCHYPTLCLTPDSEKKRK